MAMLLTACNAGGKYYEEGLRNLNIKNYAAAEESFKLAIDEGYTKDDVGAIYAIVSEYNEAKEHYDEGDYDRAKEHVDRIPHTYVNYLIAIDIEGLKGELKKIEDVVASIAPFHHGSAVGIFLYEFSVSFVGVVADLVLSLVFIIVSGNMKIVASCRSKDFLYHELFVWHA